MRTDADSPFGRKMPGKPRSESHTAKTKYGMGDYYGTGVKSKIGRMRSDSVGIRPVDKKQFKTPPKSVV